MGDGAYGAGVQSAAMSNPECLRGLRSGEWTDGFASGIGDCLAECEALCFEFNATPPSRKDHRRDLLRRILNAVDDLDNPLEFLVLHGHGIVYELRRVAVHV